ncbi:hypothetical protein Ddye_021426 [Dipteronia dyeriana]|uniref:Uncharacterized protein n=1 Tax=Dipteronia dyeriana TaxID=168575 RepID=A0AAD9WWW1_9ROSI|nr:hypothetical protein Ddye_021426 [Dipteronia dyeriana]
MAPKVNILLEHGVPKSNIFMHILHWSNSLIRDRNDFKEVVDEVKEMGINPLRSQFVLAISIKTAADHCGKAKSICIRGGVGLSKSFWKLSGSIPRL